MPFEENAEGADATAPEAAKNDAERRRETIEKLELGQLRFAKNIYDKEKARRPFLEILVENTPLGENLLKALEFEFGKIHREEFQSYFKYLENKIEDYVQAGVLSLEKIMEFLNTEIRIAYASRQQEESSGPQTENIGPFSIGIKRLNNLQEHGINPEDEVAELHFDPMEMPGVRLGVAKMRSYLGEIAAYLDKNPGIKIVFGDSWLMNHPLAASLGFTKVPGVKIAGSKYSAWTQFITKEGGLKEKELEQAIQEGRLPLESSFGYMPAQDFIARFKLR